jgi:hypothetical protein
MTAIEGFEEARQTAADGWGRDLGDVDGGYSSDAADAHASEEAARVDETDLVGRDSAEYGADDEDGVGDDDCHAAAKQFEGRIHKEGSYETTCGVFTNVSPR